MNDEDDGVPTLPRRATPPIGIPTDPVLWAPPVAPPPDPMASIVRSVKTLRWIVAAVLVPVIAAATIAVQYVYGRAESDTVNRIEHLRLREDVRDLKDQRDTLKKELRDAQEALRLHAQRMDDLAERVYRRSSKW
jgi:uncharacterized protein YlxW (UPF0749 family)